MTRARRDRVMLEQRRTRAAGRAVCQRVGMNIGKIGTWTSYRQFGIERAGEAAKLVEQLGYGALWVGGSPPAGDPRPIRKGASPLAAATGILNVGGTAPGEAAAAD